MASAVHEHRDAGGAVVGQDQERHADGEEDRQPAHRRRARLAVVASGPSSRMCWPNSRSRRNLMKRGPTNMQISREPMPPIRISPSIMV